MDHNLTLLRLASSLAAHATARQGLVAENIANADTPGYRARDVADFASTLEEGPGFAARTTRAGHMDLADGDPRFEAREVAAFGAETPNGNSVSLEDQMVRGAEVRQSHDLALGVYRKTMDILRTSIGKG
ncbi:FlgB family protein [Amaricoccus sp.]|uniref:FlgB family protein n=1 Tax=Amaricoccus sp. TaxID=1872485 RepID=UPI001B7BBF6E|nr:FlgB family protein [Amaricoccus sp.]MBP7001952.1 FlgB family protein [Amaricoccus sp.]